SKKQKVQYADGIKEKFWAKSFKPVLIKDKEQYQTDGFTRRLNEMICTSKHAFTRRLNQMICTHRHAFRPEHKGGFDVVIGNPTYLVVKG
ncbi:MAG: hypothetical protein U9N85_05790, partial [Bacteroidota bacterium]|nr:hypothetical protein [Bacteroidota bacterium]